MNRDKCGACGTDIYRVQKFMGEWVSLETELVRDGPRYVMHRTPDGGALVAREKVVAGYKRHNCKAKPTIGGHTPQLF